MLTLLRRRIPLPWQINGYYLDLDAADLALVNAAAVSSWPAHAGSTIGATQASGTNQPTFRTNIINGHPAVRFDGSNDYMTLSQDLAGTEHTLFFVVNKTAIGSNYQALMGIGEFFVASRYDTYDQWGVYIGGGGQNSSSGQKLDSSFRVLSVVMRAANDFDVVTGGFKTSYTAGTASSGTTSEIGRAAAYYHPGDYARIIGYSRALSNAERGYVEAYLYARYALAASAGNLLIFDGDSLTSGVGGTPYPTQLKQQLTFKHTASNLGVSGQHINQMSADAATQIDPLFNAANAHNVVLAMGGVNDLFNGQSGAGAYSEYVAYCQARQAVGWTVVAFTITPTSGTGVAAGYETERQSFNALVRTNYSTFSSALADVAADTRIGDAGDELNTTYYNADKTHLTTAGYAIVATIALAALATVGVT